MSGVEGSRQIRKDYKFEIFLKRSLDQETFEKIKYYDLAVIFSKKYDKAYRNVVIGDKWIYSTESPPKKITKEVHFRDVISIEWLRDYPDFLEGEFRTDCQHILVRYFTDPATRRRRARIGDTTTGGDGGVTARSGLDTTRSGLDTTRSGMDMTHQVNGTNDAGREIAPEGDAGAEEPPVGCCGRRGKNTTTQPTQPTQPTPVDTRVPVVAPQGDTGAEEPPVGCCGRRGKNTTTEPSQPTQQPPVDTRVAAVPPQGDTDAEEPPVGCCGRRGKNTTTQPSQQQVDATAPTRAETGNGMQLDLSGVQTSQLGTTTRSANGDLTSRTTATKQPRKEAELHIYILNGDAPALRLIKSAWNTYLLHGTLLKDPHFEEQCTARGVPLDDQALGVQFGRMRMDLVACKHDMEAIFYLTNELRNATRRNFALKKLFWKYTELFAFFVSQLSHVLPKSELGLRIRANRPVRADELDFALAILDLLAIMFEETDTLSSMANCLRLGSSRVVYELVTLILPDPALPPPLTESQALSDPSLTYTELEFTRLVGDITSVQASILFGILQASRDAGGVAIERDRLTEDRIVHFIADSGKPGEQFLSRMLAEIFDWISHKATHELSPRETVVLFREFTILKSLLRFSVKIREFLVENYMEEFKYFIQAPVIVKRLNSDYPITWPTLGTIADVTSLVTGKPCYFVR